MKNSSNPLTEAMFEIRDFPTVREVVHCGSNFQVSPFDIYAICPSCFQKIKLRSMSAVTELEDVFDEFFEWLTKPGALEAMQRRQEQLVDD